MSVSKKSSVRHSRISHITGTLWKYCNQPLLVGFIILIGTYSLQQYNWKDQQRFISKELKQREAVAEASSTEEQVAAAVGKRLNACAIVINAHEQGFKPEQVGPTISEYNILQQEWDKNEDTLKVRVDKSFTGNAKIISAWTYLLGRLEDLDTQVIKLSKFTSSDPSKAHEDEIATCKKQRDKIENDFKALLELMTTYTQKRSQ